MRSSFQTDDATRWRARGRLKNKKRVKYPLFWKVVTCKIKQCGEKVDHEAGTFTSRRTFDKMTFLVGGGKFANSLVAKIALFKKKEKNVSNI